MIFFDCEVYKNYFLVCFINNINNKVLKIEAKGLQSYLTEDDVNTLGQIIEHKELCGFNSMNYDVAIVLYAMQYKTCKEIYELSKYIIENNVNYWETERKFCLNFGRFKSHLDLKEVAPSMCSLKMYAARSHFENLQDLPIPPSAELSTGDMDTINKYCVNDVYATINLYDNIIDRLKLRKHMGKMYYLDLLSKSDAQIAEKIIVAELQKLDKRYIKKNNNIDQEFKYKAPSYINFENIENQELLNKIHNHTFKTELKKEETLGKVIIPEFFKELINVGKAYYKLGIGGIHSTEKNKWYKADKDYIIVDKDVTSYYPSLIINTKIIPKNLSSNFLVVYENLLKKRIEAKKSGDKTTSDGLKIALNGTFGKMSSRYSYLYDPESLIKTTLTGQLAMLMLIETLENNGIEVISANTDGITTYISKDKEKQLNKICEDWEKTTGLNLEETQYKQLFIKDVSNYIAEKLDYNVKGKGIFGETTLTKNPNSSVIKDAIINYVTLGLEIKDTILACKDIRKFIIARKVKGGAMHNNVNIGKTIRYINSKNGSVITYVENGNKVSLSDNALPFSILPKAIPKCLDYNWYIKEAEKILDNIINA